MITQEALEQLGFHCIRMNPALNEGYLRWLKAAVLDLSIIVTFSCVYCMQQDKTFIVWIRSGSGFTHNETQLLTARWHALTGQMLAQADTVPA